MTVFCDGPIAPLCSEISVGTPKETRTPDGGLAIEAAPVVVHLFKNLDGLVPGLPLGSILSGVNVERLLGPGPGASGLSLGPATPVPGIRLELARARAEVTGARVLGAAVERGTVAGDSPAVSVAPPAAPRTLPNTGGTPMDAAPYAVPGLFGGSAVLATLRRRLRAS